MTRDPLYDAPRFTPRQAAPLLGYSADKVRDMCAVYHGNTPRTPCSQAIKCAWNGVTGPGCRYRLSQRDIDTWITNQQTPLKWRNAA